MTTNKPSPILICVKRGGWDVLSRNPASVYWFTFLVKIEKFKISQWVGKIMCNASPEGSRGWLVAGTNSFLSWSPQRLETAHARSWKVCLEGPESFVGDLPHSVQSWEGKSFRSSKLSDTFDLKCWPQELINTQPRKADLSPAPTGPGDSAKVSVCTKHGGQPSQLLAIEMSNKSWDCTRGGNEANLYLGGILTG